MTSQAASSPTDGRATRWAGQRERRRREFVDAALRAIAAHGPEASTEQIATEAGVARTRLYKYFADATDLHDAIADRAAELITAELAPIWHVRGTAMELINTIVGAHTAWLADHGHLYRYLTVHSVSARSSGQDPIADVKTAIASQLTVMFEQYLSAFGLEARYAEPAAFALVGLVESTTARWLENPGDLTREELTGLQARWVWRILDDTLRERGIELDPHMPLPVVPADSTDAPARAVTT